MSEIASASINRFGIEPKADFVPPSEQLITLTICQLQDLITQAVKEAIQPLQDEVSQLQEQRDQDHQEIAELRQMMASLEARQDQDINRICLDIAYDRQRLSKLEEPKEPQPLQKDRGEILRALLAANGGKMLAKDARQKMHLGKEQFSLLISKMGDYIETKPLHSDNRKKVLILKSDFLNS